MLKGDGSLYIIDSFDVKVGQDDIM